jgi:Arc/MetJ-type ribon-helix-helix transcriptional regulator
MASAKVAVTIDTQLLEEIDRWVAAGEFPTRSRVVQIALGYLRQQRGRRQSLLYELAKLDPAEERALAEEALAGEPAWPEY